MNILELKPDFEKIFFALQCHEKTKGIYLQDWERISKGDESYSIKDNEIFKQLIEDYQLNNHNNELLFIAFVCLKYKDQDRRIEDFLKLHANEGTELLEALKFLFDNDLTDLKLDIKHQKQNISVSIKNLVLIFNIRKALLNFFIEHDIYFQQGIVEPDKIKDWGRYIDFVKAEKDAYERKKGRKTKYHSTGRLINFLQKYLQEYTEIKANKGVIISRQQASFIHKYFRLFDIIPDNLSWGEDNIRHILTKHIGKVNSYVPPEITELLTEHSQKIKVYKSKIKDINKNK